MNVNAATAREPDALPGIGPVLAGRIVAGRPYRSAEDLDRVPGIGPTRVPEIRRLVAVE